MIDPTKEELITPNEATRYYPRSARGKKVHISKVYRDMQVGHQGLKLESIRTPRLATSREAVSRFFHRLSGKPGKEASKTQKSNRYGEERQVEQELDRLGI